MAPSSNWKSRGLLHEHRTARTPDRKARPPFRLANNLISPSVFDPLTRYVLFIRPDSDSLRFGFFFIIMTRRPSTLDKCCSNLLPTSQSGII